jgi:hypothetical protein
MNGMAWDCEYELRRMIPRHEVNLPSDENFLSGIHEKLIFLQQLAIRVPHTRRNTHVFDL